MDPSDRMPEERIGPIQMIRNRADEFERLANGCDVEAWDRAQEVKALQDRAQTLRTIAAQYRVLAGSPESGSTLPEQAEEGRVFFEQDPVDRSTFRRHQRRDGKWVRA